jgi:arsenate reductase
MQRRPRVLFLSTGDSTRGLMAEGFLRALAGEQFQPVSVGLGVGDVHPSAVHVMGEIGIDISNQTPRTVTEALREQFTYAIILYDSAKERPPIFPFAPRLLRWSIIDPSTVESLSGERSEVFRRVRDEIRRNIETFVNEAVPQRQLPAAA